MPCLRHRVMGGLRCAFVALCLCTTATTLARAQSELGQLPPASATASASARDGLFLSELIAPAANRASPGVAFAVGGYDGGLKAGIMKATADVRVIGPLDLRLGLRYTPEVREQGQVQPQVGVRIRALSQAKQGVDLAVAVQYRMDRFTDDEGLVEGVLALGRRFGRLATFANIGYGQDPEGDDHEGSVALAVLFEANASMQVGVESHARFDMFSDDPKRVQRNDPELQWMVGPLLQYSLGRLSALAQLGASGVRVANTTVGLAGLAGLAFAY